MLLKDKVALVTGASRGIGREIALAFAASGAHIAVNYAGNAEKAEEVANAVRSFGVEAFAIRADVSNETEVQEMFRQVLEKFGKLDILVNNAGITRDNLLMRMKEAEWDAVIDTNLKGVFLCTKAAARPMMKQRSGKIINIASVVGISGNPGQANYTAAKAGAIGLTKTAARELASRGITVNAIAPGMIETDMTDKLPEDIKEGMLGQIPLSRFGKPEDVAKAALFLASGSSDYITGQTIRVDGGMVM
ncbi:MULTISPECIES: 3-oxoacyl-[acyl-carrier-protein] reductase [Heyndrickxia]|uniref:3-oxoacyl-[acyl-carrier-protein] reductase n=1 Tax=Heyndrickxia TaxID=2837504 RepID=UPI00077925DC|nr:MULTISPECIES: 3-oxoacyl-[acyl-carrier-protein] reductase [Heyndrickxia]KYC59281.1 3-oxoacyl-[acyl-carrier protein] reductase [Heyndrickxia coagulans]MEC2305663.1 3-oxoacyl-[acyl-carrier-protein] reductase [Weizmannia sp. CD-2023]MEC2339881.1 3-oxoacyl-[acyl-carrier-protein] reductase [Weizmannia sp. CD-2023]QWU07493.1 3-oxoacyl-[acyl-carrier-protein] reductase [Heyndrickxia coagulans]